MADTETTSLQAAVFRLN